MEEMRQDIHGGQIPLEKKIKKQARSKCRSEKSETSSPKKKQKKGLNEYFELKAEN